MRRPNLGRDFLYQYVATMDQQEIHRITQYVTGRTSYSRDVVEDIVQTGMQELTSLAQTSTQKYERQHLVEYVCLWTVRRTKHPEPMVREVLECSGLWLDTLCRTTDQEDSEGVSQADQN
jgi:ribosome maturation protein Sdo1